MEDTNSLLGRGGYGNVYHGQYKGKSVAIKKYICSLEDAFKELRSEAMMLQNLHHPCLVCLVGVCLNPYALVLEEAPLGSLKSHIILEDPVPLARLVTFRIATQVAAALRFLHSRGVIFRDLKSSNVLLWSLDPDALCHCKVTDFGLATTQSPVGALGVEGTKRFIAPEVLYPGRRRTVYTHKADIFSFAMFLYQCHLSFYRQCTQMSILTFIHIAGVRPTTSDHLIQKHWQKLNMSMLIQCDVSSAGKTTLEKRPSNEIIIVPSTSS